MSTQKQVNARRPRTCAPHKAKLGQNFLVDRNAARRIVDALGDISQSVVVEIGPGRGVLTQMTAERARRLLAIEFDSMLARDLRAAFASSGNVEIIEGDFLKVQLPQLLLHDKSVKVIGNIPYYITSDILLHLFEQHASIETIVVMVQREVADRLAAAPGNRNYGLLTVTANLFADVELLFTLPPGAFSPPPQVHSSVLRLRISPKAPALQIDSDQLLKFCKLGFGQKRKTLFNNLRGRYGEKQIRQAMEGAGVRADARAEALSLVQLAAIYRAIKADT